MGLNYFVCTLGEAHSLRRPFRDVNHLVEKQAEEHPDVPAIGSFIALGPGHDNALKPVVLTFLDVQQQIIRTASILEAKAGIHAGKPVGLLCSSSLNFLRIWLACIRLGCPILLIAPECSTSDITQLCQSCEVSLLLVDGKHEELGYEVAAKVPNGGLRCIRHPLDGADLGSLPASEQEMNLPQVGSQNTCVAYWHHSSGTSSGVPKPIPQTHHGAVGALPSFDGQGSATFTTTPLYHGGPADIFRAWTSHALIWLFPSSDLPITASNVVRCLNCAGSLAESGEIATIKYFTSVPFVLESMVAEPEGLELLKGMELVGVGGASLSPNVGNDLVISGVSLVSRYGSAECGFLLSSHREYGQDRDWQSLRLPQSTLQLRFEEREDDLSELIVPSDWPQLAKKNRDDGSYATEDLFMPQPSIPNAWKYHSPAGARLTLSTGKKFDPTAIEAIIRHDSFVEDALVFGSSRPYPGVLVFRNGLSKGENDESIVQLVALLIDEINKEGQDQARISRDMILPMPAEENPIAKSSKGTVLRSRAETKYEKQIDQAYSGTRGISLQSTKDEDLPASIKRLIQHILPPKGPLHDQTDLISYGVDSVASIQIRKGLHQLLPQPPAHLPLNIVEDCGTISALTSYILRLRHGDEPSAPNPDDDDHAYMLQLVEEFSSFPEPPLVPSSSPTSPSPASPPFKVEEEEPQTLLLTGATGSLGATLLSLLLSLPSPPRRIHALLRASSDAHARERIFSVFESRQLPPPAFFPDGPLEAHAADLSRSDLGLGSEKLGRLRASVTRIIHLAWNVNFRMKLGSFRGHDLAGVRNLLGFAMRCEGERAPRFVFCSSLAAVGAVKGDEGGERGKVEERGYGDPRVAAPVGYARSKWVAEGVCQRVNERGRMKGSVTVYRVGQLAGHSESGVWNAKEAWPLMLSTARGLKCLPRLEGERLKWLPVDVAARAFVEGMAAKDGKVQEGGVMRIYHVLNDNGATTWNDMVEWLERKIGVEMVSPEEWLRKLEAKAAEEWKHPAVHLLEHWKSSLLEGDATVAPQFDMQKTKETISSLRGIDAVDEQYFDKLWTWIDGNVK